MDGRRVKTVSKNRKMNAEAERARRESEAPGDTEYGVPITRHDARKKRHKDGAVIAVLELPQGVCSLRLSNVAPSLR